MAPSSTGKTFAWLWPLMLACAALGLWRALDRFGLRPDLRLLGPVVRVGVPSLLLGWFALLSALVLLLPARGAPLLAALAVAVGAVATTVGNPEGIRPASLDASVSCLGIGLAVPLAPLALGLVVLYRRRLVAGGAAVGAALGASAGLVGLAALHLRCSLVGPSHLLLFHEGSLLLSALIGALAGGRVTAAMAQRGTATR